MIMAPLGLAAPGLPDFRPGALPRLASLIINAQHQRAEVELPARWGIRGGALAQLTKLELLVPIRGGLPAEWAKGFSQLESLTVADPRPAVDAAAAAAAGAPTAAAAEAAPAGQPEPGLPPSWGHGFPSLKYLKLVNLHLPPGPLPPSWVDPALGTKGLASLEIL